MIPGADPIDHSVEKWLLIIQWALIACIWIDAVLRARDKGEKG